MKKSILLTLFLLLILPLTVFADEPKILTLDAEVDDNTINYSGTTEEGSHAVMCKLLDDNEEEIDKKSIPVDNNNFEGSFIAPSTGDYSVKCANYEGGDIKGKDVTVAEMAEYTITFDTNGGSNIAQVKVESGGTVPKPANPTKENYVFEGWYEDGTLEIAYDWTKVINSNMTLYANWIKETKELQVVFIDEGSGTFQVDFETDDPDNQGPLAAPINHTSRYFIETGKTATLTVTASNNYDFMGWYNCEEYDISGDNHLGIMGWRPVGDAISTDATYTFTATEAYYNIMPLMDPKAGHNNIWATEGGQIAVIHENGDNPELDGEHWFDNGIAVDYWKGDTITIKAKAKEGYHFIGWFQTDPEASVAENYVREPVISTNTSYTYQPKVTTVQGVDEPLNYLTAAFEEDGQVTVSFETNGGSTIADIVIDSGSTIAKPANPTKDNYTFAGWYEDGTFEHEFNFNTPITENITIYANWEEIVNKHTVTFETNGGSNIDPVEVNEGSKVAEPNAPTKNGFVFDGWYEDEELTIEADFNEPIMEERTFYAKWGKEYKLSDDDNNEAIFVEEPNQNLSLVITDLSNLTDDELEGMNPPMDRETYEAVIESITEAAKEYGTLITFLDISVLKNNTEPVDVGQVRIKLRLTDEMKKYKSFKLVYLTTDNNDNIVLDEDEAHTLTVEGDFLVGTLPHLSAYVLVGNNNDNTNTSTATATKTNNSKNPLTLDNIYLWIGLLLISVIGLTIGGIAAKKIKNQK